MGQLRILVVVIGGFQWFLVVFGGFSVLFSGFCQKYQY